MKRNIFALALVLGAFTFQSCENDDMSHSGNQLIEATFTSMYPAATNISWEKEGQYSVVEFRLGNRDLEARFDSNGVWQMTETDIRFEDLPQAVKTAFAASEYQSWRIDDLDKIERKDKETVYVLEVEKGDQECDLYYLADGTLRKTDNDAPNSGNQLVEATFASMYPAATNISWEKEGQYSVVEFRLGNRDLEARFDSNGVWQMTETDIRFEDLPQAVKTAFAASEYQSWQIDDLDKIERKDKETIYVLEVEKGDQECDLYYLADGTLSKTDNDAPNPGNQLVEATFASMYPAATNISWEKSGRYSVADFRLENREMEAWFDPNGEWQMTETDIRFEDLPQAVKTAFAASEYQSWQIDDLDKIERKDKETVYVLEVEKGDRECDLYYLADGTLSKTVTE